MTRHLAWSAGLLAAVLLPVSGRAQRLQFTVGGTGAQQMVQSHVNGSNDRFAGLLLGGEGALMSGKFVVRVRYGEGRISPKSGTTAEARDVVEGEALVGIQAVPWLTLWAGPSARAYTMGDSDERWMMWSVRATGRAALIPGRMQSFLELWGALSGNAGGDPPLKAGGRGVYGGLEARLGEASALWGRLGYRMESQHADGLRETVESLTLSLIYGLPQ